MIEVNERYWAKVDRRGKDECWPWLAYRFPTGHGQIRVNKRLWPAHVVAFFAHHGRLPEGVVHHECRNPCCVNPLHLREMSRAAHVREHDNQYVGRTHCPQGHPYAGTNLILYRGRRYCRVCKNRHNRDLRQRRAASPR